MQTLESLRAEILARYASIHAFCRMNPDLKRATVYLVLSGKYPGKTKEQAARIRAALHEKDAGAATHGPDLPREEVVLALQSIRCGHCRKLDKRGCPECRRQTEREARELYARLYPGL
ncbi:MAG: hypothetical protein J1E80_06635 [Desulfovibrionaceae bacterium]|nr:hypothetical protein [Desulfovibrionaceae bacterium]